MIEIARLLAQAQEDFSAFDMSLWFRDYRGPPEGADFILSQDLAQDYICSADVSDQTYPVLAAILRLYAEDSEPWDPVIRTLIRRGADVHAPVHRYLRHLDQSEYLCPLAQYGTPLDELFMETLDPLEGQAAADGWLQILASEGHDILAYLKTESALHVKPIQLTHPSYQRLEEDDNERKLVFDFGACPSVSWDWWISPSSPASLLREEFKFMAITPPNGWLLYFWKDAWPI